MYRSDRWLHPKLKALLGDAKIEPALQWLRAAREQPPVLFVGAGFSLNSTAKESSPGRRMMSWKDLTKLLKDGLGADGDGTDFLWIAEKYKCLFGDFELHSRIIEAVPDVHVDPGLEHHALRHIPWHTVLTLNYDTLLERAFQSAGSREVVPVISHEQLVRVTARSSLPIIHLHGHIEHPSKIVLTLEDFRRYPDDHSVFLTVARQLLLQHPVLFLGFGANDPNFVAWSGWIRDELGDQSPPWLRLEPKQEWPPDPGMEAYWSPRLKTVVYERANFVALLECLGKAIEPLGVADEAFIEYVDELVALTRNIPPTDKAFFPAVVREIETALEQKHSGPLDFIAGRSRLDRVVTLLALGLERAGLSRDASSRSTGRSREEMTRWAAAGATFTSSTPADTFPPSEEQKKTVRNTMGDSFLPWLLAGVRLIGRFIPLSRETETRLDAVEEYELLRGSPVKDKEDAAALRELGLLTLPHVMDRIGRVADERSALEWLGLSTVFELRDGDKRVVEDLLQRHQLHWGELPAKPTDIADAQGARRTGYLAVMEGRTIDAADAYERAASLSRAEQEPVAVKFMTARSAQAVLVSGMFRGGMLGGATMPAGAQRRVAGEAQLRGLREEAASLRVDLAFAEREHATDRAKRLAAEVDALTTDEPDRVLFHGRNEPLEPVLDFYEQYWFSPTLSGAVAEAVAETRWELGEKASAATLLAQFGSEALARRCKADTRRPRRGPLDEVVLNELLRPPRWAHERHARIAALVEVASELPASKRDVILELALEGYKALREQFLLLAHSHRFPATPAVSLGLALAPYTPWATFKTWLLGLRERAGADLSQLGDADWIHLPTRWWVGAGGLRGLDLDDLLGFLFQLAEDVAWRVSKDGVLDLMTNVVASHPVQLPATGKAATEMRAWLEDGRPRDNDDEWLRTECSVTLAKIDGVDAADVRSRRATPLHELVSATIASSARWPRAFVVRAWLACVDNLVDANAALARQLLAIPAPKGSDELQDRGDRRMDLRARLGIIARLGMGLDAERDHWVELVDLAAARDPGLLAELCDRPFGQLDPAVRAAVLRSVAAAFSPAEGHRQRTERYHAALSCLDRAGGVNGVEVIPVAWVFGATTLTTSAYPNTAVFACTVLRNIVQRNADQWREAHASMLEAIRLGLLRAASEGRASVVAAARRALLDCADITSELVQKHITQHAETRQLLTALEKDVRLAVVAAGESWVREPTRRFEPT